MRPCAFLSGLILGATTLLGAAPAGQGGAFFKDLAETRSFTNGLPTQARFTHPPGRFGGPASGGKAGGADDGLPASRSARVGRYRKGIMASSASRWDFQSAAWVWVLCPRLPGPAGIRT